MKNSLKIVCFLVTIMLIVGCFIGCGTKTTSTSEIGVTTAPATTVASTTQAVTTTPSTTVAPTTAPKPKATEPNTEPKEENSYVDSVEDNGGSNDYSSEDYDVNYNTYDNYDSDAVYSPSEFQNTGVIDWGGYEWTYYSELILPGEGLDIPGRYTTEDGYVCDGDGYVVLAADLDMLPRYSIVDTPFGCTGKVYDTGCSYGTFAVYVGW
jgi:hypothetical protein